MTSKTGICNLALGHIGVSREVANVDTEASAEARAFRRFYEPVRDEVLRAFAWPFTRKVEALALVEEEPTTEWAYAYQYPSDCHVFRRILSGTRNDDRQSKVPYLMAHGTSGQVIFTDQDNAVAEWSLKVTDPDRFPPDFVMALSFLLAHRVAPVLTGGDPYRLGDRAYQQYEMKITKAEATSLEEEQPEEEPDSEFGRFR